MRPTDSVAPDWYAALKSPAAAGMNDQGREMYCEGSKYADHPRITWFGTGGTVAYVDYTGPMESYFIGGDGGGGFKVIPPSMNGSLVDEILGFATIDAGIEHALAAKE